MVLELMTAIFSIVQGIVSTIMKKSGMAGGSITQLPEAIVEKVESVGMLESIPLWIVTVVWEYIGELVQCFFDAHIL